MALTKAFYEALEAKELKKLRIMMSGSMLLDPSFAEFNEMENACKSLENLYDVHDGRELKLDKSCWNDDYMNLLMVQVVGNFSRERVEHLKNVVRYLRPVGSVPKNSYSAAASNNVESKIGTTQAEDDTKMYQKVAVRAIAGAAIGGAVVAITHIVSVTTGIAIGAVAGGVIAKVNADRRK